MQPRFSHVFTKLGVVDRLQAALLARTYRLCNTATWMGYGHRLGVVKWGVLGWWLVATACQPTQGARHDPGAASLTSLVSVGNSSTTMTGETTSLETPAQASDMQAPETSSGMHAAPPFDLATSVLADTDPHNDGDVAPPAELSGCLEELERLGAQFVTADIPLSQKRNQVFTCGATQVVVYKGRKDSPKYNSSPQLTCRMALGLIRFEELCAELAQKHFGLRVQRIEQGGTYSCRKMARFVNLVSEHSYANAIDVRSLRLSNGSTITVKRHFGDLETEPLTKESKFLRELASRLYDDGVFSVVLTPFFDRLHHDHFHFDQARYRVDGTR